MIISSYLLTKCDQGLKKKKSFTQQRITDKEVQAADMLMLRSAGSQRDFSHPVNILLIQNYLAWINDCSKTENIT